MKKNILLCCLSICLSLYSQENDSIFHIGKEDDWRNTYQYIDMIKKDIDENILLMFDSIKKPLDGKIVISFTVSEKGDIQNTKIEKSLREDVDSILISIINSLKFEDAPLYDNKGQPHAINFTLPIKIEIP
jgi:Periplasmic protein TonB, links inner and outer membranes